MKNMIAVLAGVVLLSVPNIVYADPPSGTLAEVTIRTATETVRGHITYGWQDVPSPDEYLSGKDYSDSDSLREIVKKRGSAQLMLDLIRVATPRAMYVFSSERTFPSADIKAIGLVKGAEGTRVAYDEGILRIDSNLGAIIAKKPEFQCWQDYRTSEGRSIAWVSWNPKIGEDSLKGECSGEKKYDGLPKSGLSKAGMHPNLKGVFWFSFWTD